MAFGSVMKCWLPGEKEEPKRGLKRPFEEGTFVESSIWNSPEQVVESSIWNNPEQADEEELGQEGQDEEEAGPAQTPLARTFPRLGWKGALEAAESGKKRGSREWDEEETWPQPPPMMLNDEAVAFATKPNGWRGELDTSGERQVSFVPASAKDEEDDDSTRKRKELQTVLDSEKMEALYGIGAKLLFKNQQQAGVGLGNRKDAIASCLRSDRRFSGGQGLGFMQTSAPEKATKPADWHPRVKPPKCTGCLKCRWPAWKSRKGKWHCGYCHRPDGGKPRCYRCSKLTWDGWNGPVTHNREWWCSTCWCNDQEEEGSGMWKAWFAQRREQFPEVWSKDAPEGPELLPFGGARPKPAPGSGQASSDDDGDGEEDDDDEAAGRPPSELPQGAPQGEGAAAAKIFAVPVKPARPVSPSSPVAQPSLDPPACTDCKQERWPVWKAKSGKLHCGYCHCPDRGRPECHECKKETWDGWNGGGKKWWCRDCWCARHSVPDMGWFGERAARFPREFADGGPELLPPGKRKGV